MAKGDVTMKFDAQTSAFVQNVLKAKAAMEEGADKARKFGEETAKGGDRAADSIAKAGKKSQESKDSFLSAGLAIEGIGKAAAFVGQIWSAQLDDMARKAGVFEASVKGIQSALGASGQLSSTPGVRKALGTLGGDVMGPKEVEALFAQISKTAGAENTPEEKLRATRAAINARTAGVEDAGAFGNTFAQLARQKGGDLAGLGDEQLEEATAHIQKFKPGGLSEQDLRFLQRSPNQLEGINMLLAGSRSAESAKGLEALEEASSEEVDSELRKKAKKHPHKLTDDEKRKLRLNAIPEADRMSAILQDPTLAPQAKRRSVANLASHLEDHEIEGAIEGSEFGQQMATQKRLESSDLTTAREARIRRAKIQAERLDRKAGGEAIDFESRSLEDSNALRESGLENSFLRNRVMDVHNFLGGKGQNENRDQHIQELKKHTELIEEQNDLLRRPAGGTTLQSDKEGAK